MPSDYIEPSNEQLANFLIVYIPSQMGLDLHPDASVVQFILESKPEVRQRALEHHRKFHAQIDRIDQMIQAGTLPCDYIRPNGKQCPNYNEPGSLYCGLHQDADKEL